MVLIIEAIIVLLITPRRRHRQDFLLCHTCIIRFFSVRQSDQSCAPYVRISKIKRVEQFWIKKNK